MRNRSVIQQSLHYAVYFAPRGRDRLLVLGEQIAQRHLNYSDKLVGIVGDSGSGKSSIIQGMFPGLDLVNHDDGLSISKVMQMREGFLDRNLHATTYHMDMRFQLAFTQIHEIVEFVTNVLDAGKRMVIEHFDLLAPYLNHTAAILVGCGGEIIVTKPNLFGPSPEDIKKIVFKSLKYRKMLHTAEDLTKYVIRQNYQNLEASISGEVKKGFILYTEKKPPIDLHFVEREVLKLIEKDYSIAYGGEDHIIINNEIYFACQGPRIHVSRTGKIQGFSLQKDFFYDNWNDCYCMVGLVEKNSDPINELNRLEILN